MGQERGLAFDMEGVTTCRNWLKGAVASAKLNSVSDATELSSRAVDSPPGPPPPPPPPPVRVQPTSPSGSDNDDCPCIYCKYSILKRILRLLSKSDKKNSNSVSFWDQTFPDWHRLTFRLLTSDSRPVSHQTLIGWSAQSVTNDRWRSSVSWLQPGPSNTWIILCSMVEMNVYMNWIVW